MYPGQKMSVALKRHDERNGLKYSDTLYDEGMMVRAEKMQMCGHLA